MNALQRLILNNSDWRKQLDGLGVNTKEKNGYIIFKYRKYYDDNPPVFDSDVVRNCRGIILDTLNNYQIVCRPFDKFFSYYEKYYNEDTIDWDSAYATEKIDGSLITLWWSERYNEWVFSTSGMIYASDASSMDKSCSLLDMIMSTEEYSKINYDKLNKNYTYIFELVHPLQRVVIKYTVPMLWHIATRDNKSGKYIEENFGVRKPIRREVKSLEEVKSFVKVMNDNCRDIKHEGFVVNDKYGNRIKVKTEEYIRRHRITTGKLLQKEDVIDSFMSGKPLDIEDFTDYMKMLYHFYSYQWYTFINTLEYKIDKYRGLFDELDGDRKRFAEIIKNEKFKSSVFIAIDNPEMDVYDVVGQTRLSVLCKYIHDYTGKIFE